MINLFKKIWEVIFDLFISILGLIAYIIKIVTLAVGFFGLSLLPKYLYEVDFHPILKMIAFPIIIIFHFFLPLAFTVEGGILTYMPLISLMLLIYGYPNITYIIFSLIFLIIRPFYRTIWENIKYCFSIKEMLFMQSPMALVLIVAFTYALTDTGSQQDKVWASSTIYHFGPLYVISLLIILIVTYLNSKREEEAKKQVEIQKLFKLFQRHKITEITYPVMCPSCGSTNLLELGEGKSCDYCGGWLSRELR